MVTRMATEITVRGTCTISEAPERGTVRATIAYEGTAPEPVYQRVAKDLHSVTASIKPLSTGDPPAVTRWTAGQLRTWSERPWNQEGKRMPLVHHARVDVEARFRDLVALSRWVGEQIAYIGSFGLSGVDWMLTPSRRNELLEEVRAGAVADAVVRAQQYADALGLGKVRPVAVADAGMLGANLPPQGGGPAYLRAAGVAGGGGTVELLPADIEVSAEVDARFVAGESD